MLDYYTYRCSYSGRDRITNLLSFNQTVCFPISKSYINSQIIKNCVLITLIVQSGTIIWKKQGFHGHRFICPEKAYPHRYPDPVNLFSFISHPSFQSAERYIWKKNMPSFYSTREPCQVPCLKHSTWNKVTTKSHDQIGLKPGIKG